MIESHHELNVSCAGMHFMRVVLSASLTIAQCKDRARFVQAKFGPSYKVTLTFVECIGHGVDFTDFTA